MNCNDLHKKLIFFIEAELPKEQMQKIQLHLNDCKECSLFLEDMRKTMAIIETDRIQKTDPYFYSRLKARMENETEARADLKRQPAFVRILQPALFTILLLVGIYSGYKIGGNEATYKSAGIENQDMIPYLDEMKTEAIETFLLE